MPIPTRLVCSYCLASIESSSEDDRRALRDCPSCGSLLENDDGEIPEFDQTIDAPFRRETRQPALPTPRSDTQVPLPPIGRFTLGSRLGGGGYGDVFQAHDPRLDRSVALKILKATKLDAKAIERFLREARAAARLEHPFIVGLHDAGQDEGRLWIAYQLVQGKTLSEHRDSQLLDIRAAVMIIRDVAEALDHAHRRGITHRDIKPANVIIDVEGRPHLTDFGLARRLDIDSELTGEGTVLGTPAYMSPEQAAGRANAADGRSDIYSLGVVLYELICGRRPSDVPSNTPIWKLDRSVPPLPPQSVDRTIPRELDRICMKSLALNPEDRFQSARAMAQSLEEWLLLVPPPRLNSRKHISIAVMVISILTFGCFLVYSQFFGSKPPATTEFRPQPLVGTRPETNHAVPLAPQGEEPLVVENSLVFPVVVNLDNHKVHLPNCSALKQMAPKRRKEFPSLAAAASEGHLDICKTCGKRMPKSPYATHDEVSPTTNDDK